MTTKALKVAEDIHTGYRPAVDADAFRELLACQIIAERPRGIHIEFLTFTTGPLDTDLEFSHPYKQIAQ